MVSISAGEKPAPLCPACEGKMQLTNDVRQNEIVECPECRAELEVMGVNPVILTLAPDVDEEWGE